MGEANDKLEFTDRQDSLRWEDGLPGLASQASSRGEDSEGSGEGAGLLASSLPARPGIRAFPYLYWIVSDVVDARNFVIRIRTMLNRNIKLIWKKAEKGHRRSVRGG